MTQLALDFTAPVVRDDALWTYHRGLPDRTGMAAYLHLVRGPHDPRETKARGAAARAAGERKPSWQKRMGTAEEWCERIVAVFADGRGPRTFNALCVQLTGTTADVVFGSAIDEGLWLACERGLIAWTPTRPVYWIDAASVKWAA